MDTRCVISIDGLIFDLDGTLADTLADITAGVNAGMASVGLPAHRAEDVRRWVGDGLTVLMQRALPAEHHDLIPGVVEVVADHYRHHHGEKTRLYPGIAELLDALETSRVRICVLSNKPHEFTMRMVAGLFSRWTIDGVLGCTEDAQRKPHPYGALALAGHMELPVERVVFVGDSATDVQTARNAGMRSVAVTWGFRDRPELDAAAPTWIIDRPAELLMILERERGARES